MNDLLPAARDRLAEEQHQIVGLCLRKRRIGPCSPPDDGDRVGATPSAIRAARISLGISSGPAIAQIVVAVADIGVEMAGDLGRNRRHILVAPVARAGHADDPAPAWLEPVDHVDHGATAASLCPWSRITRKPCSSKTFILPGLWKKLLSKVRSPVRT